MLKSKTACLRHVISLKVTPIVRTLMLCERSLNWTGGQASDFNHPVVERHRDLLNALDLLESGLPRISNSGHLLHIVLYCYSHR